MSGANLFGSGLLLFASGVSAVLFGAFVESGGVESLLLLVFSFAVGLAGWTIARESGYGFIVDSSYLKRNAIYETVGAVRMAADEWIVLARNQEGVVGAYHIRMDNDKEPPKVFKVLGTANNRAYISYPS